MKRFRLGLFAVIVSGAFFVWIMTKQFHGSTWLELASFYLRVLCAPITVIWIDASRQPNAMLVLSLLTVGGIAASWRFERGVGALAAIIAFSSWIFCEIVVAASTT